VGVVLVLAVMSFTWELGSSVRGKRGKMRGNEIWAESSSGCGNKIWIESSSGCGKGVAGWRGWREGGEADRLVPFSGFKFPPLVVVL